MKPINPGRTRFVVPMMCIVLGCMLSGRPAYRWVRRTGEAMLARSLWAKTQSRSGDAMRADGPVMWLDIPSCGIGTPVLRGATPSRLDRFPCLSASRGGIVLGHRDSHFRGLHKLRAGDAFSVETVDGRVKQYCVVELEKLPKDGATQRLREIASDDWMVLVTCYPFRYVGPAPQRFLAWARPMS